MNKLYLDFETYNAERDIKAGTYAYAETAEPLLLAYALNNSEPRTHDFTDGSPSLPSDFMEWADDPNTILIAHNAQFDRAILSECLGVDFPLARWHCTMVKAYAHGFIGSLDKLCGILKLSQDQAKLKDGKKLINRFCKPAPASHKAERYTKENKPEEWAKFVQYAAMDIVSMREVDKRLPSWNYQGQELDLYHLDQEINDRGFDVDSELLHAGYSASVREKKNLADKFYELTFGHVERPTLRVKFMAFLKDEYGLEVENTQSATFQQLLKERDDLPETCRELLEISIQGNKTSTAKYESLIPALSNDGRFRGGLQFNGASRTRRWSGRTFQPHNLPSRGLPKDIDCYIEALKLDCHEMLFDNLMLYGSAALRGIVKAPQGKKLSVADLSNIEGRVNAWLASETWKLKAFEAYDNGTGPDLYCVTAGQLLGRDPYTIEGADRNVMGKVPELALGYESGVNGLQTFCKAYGIKMFDHWQSIKENLDPKFINKAISNYEDWGCEKTELDRNEWVASETVKLAWRDRHSNIKNLWYECKNSAVKAIKNPNKVYKAGKHLAFRTATFKGHKYLLMKLPSGRFLTYFNPKIRDGAISYYGVDSLTKTWKIQFTYGGKLVENACQSIARDVLATNMLEVNKTLPIVLTVHDEIISEVDESFENSHKELSRLMAMNPPWAKGLPLAADGFECMRYRK